jgi:hypothetical protein
MALSPSSLPTNASNATGVNKALHIYSGTAVNGMNEALK